MARLSAEQFIEQAIQAALNSQAKLGELAEDSFAKMYLTEASRIYTEQFREIRTKVTGSWLKKMGLLQYLVHSPLSAVSSNFLPFLFLPERTEAGIEMRFSHASLEILGIMENLISNLDLNRGNKQAAAILKNRLAKIQVKHAIGVLYLEERDKFEIHQQCLAAKISILDRLQPTESFVEIIEDALQYLSTIETSFLAPAREVLKPGIEGNPDAFKRKYATFLAATVTRHFSEEEIDAVVHAFCCSPITKGFNLMPQLITLARKIQQLLDERGRELEPDKLKELQQHLCRNVIDLGLPIRQPTLADRVIITAATNMTRYTNGLVRDFFKMYMLLVSVLPDSANVRKLSSTARGFILQCAVVADPSHKKFQHRVIQTTVVALYPQIIALLPMVVRRQVAHEDDDLLTLACRLLGTFAAVYKVESVPEDDYIKSKKSKVKSMASAAKRAITSAEKPQVMIANDALAQTYLRVMDQVFTLISTFKISFIGPTEHIFEITALLGEAILNGAITLNPKHLQRTPDTRRTFELIKKQLLRLAIFNNGDDATLSFIQNLSQELQLLSTFYSGDATPKCRELTPLAAMSIATAPAKGVVAADDALDEQLIEDDVELKYQ
jgi:hypothetical protein